MSVSWLLAALGLMLAGGRSRPVPSRVSISPALRLRFSAGTVAVGCLAAFGWERGTLAAAVAVPVVVTVLRRGERVPVRTAPTADLALALDLVAIALRAGQPLDRALVLAAPADEHGCADAFTRVGGLLRLGADPADAWAGVAGDPRLAAVAAAGVRSASSGIRLAGEFEQVAADVRAQLSTAAQSRAARAGVLIAAPLGLCFLPAFVCLGIAPTVVGVAGSVLT